MDQDNLIREKVLRAIALNRIPGYHFCGNFFDLHFEDVYDGSARITIPKGPHAVGNNGQMTATSVAIAADFAAASAIRSAGDPAERTATVSLHMQLTNAVPKGDIVARGHIDTFFENAQGRLALSRFEVTSDDELIGFGTGTFMLLPAPGGRILQPVPWINKRPTEPVELPAEDSLDETERDIVSRMELALESAQKTNTPFLTEFLGIRTTKLEGAARAEMRNGPHIGNRVGHVQGGVSMGVVIESANAALPSGWDLVGITASYVSPGEGETLTAYSDVVHKGRFTAVISTKLVGTEGQLILDVTTNHARSKES